MLQSFVSANEIFIEHINRGVQRMPWHPLASGKKE